MSRVQRCLSVRSLRSPGLDLVIIKRAAQPLVQLPLHCSNSGVSSEVQHVSVSCLSKEHSSGNIENHQTTCEQRAVLNQSLLSYTPHSPWSASTPAKATKTHRACNILVSITLKDKRLPYDTKATCAYKAFYLYSVWSQSHNLSVLYVCVSILVYANVCIAQ